MELYLDSADINEIEEAFQLGFLTGLTTTPTFMHRQGVANVDELILQLADMVPILQIEALGNTAEEIYAEAQRLTSLGLDPNKTVYKIPVSLEGVKACKKLTSEGLMVNIHLVYTLQQAYMAMAAGATYVCPLVGRLQDQGHDALSLVEQCVEAVDFYGYDTKVMFSSVRHPEHVRNAINLGVDTCTVPWKVMRLLTENNFTTLGTQQFVTHTQLITQQVKDIIRTANPVVSQNNTVLDALVQMTESGLGAVSVTNNEGQLIGAFTDGDLRRYLNEGGKEILQNEMSAFEFKSPITIDAQANLEEAVNLIKERKVDNVVVLSGTDIIGMLDVQDLVKLGLLG